MRKYLARRLVLMIPTLGLVSVMVFAVMRLVPGDVVGLMFQDLGYAPSLAAMRARLGLDLPFHQQYLQWVAGLLHGNFGESLWTQRTVLSLLAERLPVTLELALLAIGFAVVYGGATGILAAVRPDGWLDVSLRSLAMAFLSLPTFWLGTLVIVLPSLYLGWSPQIQLALALVALLADVLAPHHVNDTSLLRALQRPGASHWFGTDELGRDVLSRVVYGARVSMSVGLAATAISILLGGLIGVLSGYFGRGIDLVLQRVVDAWMSFPGLVMVIVILALLGPGLGNVILALGVSQAFPQSRIIRSATLAVREQSYIEASRAVGGSHGRILGRHVVPNIVAPVVIAASNALGFVILVEAAVSFLGYGVPPPQPSWGGMLSATGRVYMVRAPWLSIFPGVALSLAVFGFNVLGDALRDLLDPRLRGAGGLGERANEHGVR